MWDEEGGRDFGGEEEGSVEEEIGGRGMIVEGSLRGKSLRDDSIDGTGWR